MPASPAGSESTKRPSAVSPIEAPHRRYNPLADEWVLVSPDRAQRPWQGDLESPDANPRPPYDPSCYLCPGNERAGGHRNSDYGSTFIFENDFAALRPDTAGTRFEDGLLIAEGERGTCRVLCFSPRHDLSLGQLTPSNLRRVIDIWAEQSVELGHTYRWVQVFENRGREMGASNPHPHGQIWAGSAVPVQAAREDKAQRSHHRRTGQLLLVDYAHQEAGGARVVSENGDWLVVVPFWATWPFETLVVPRAPAQRLSDLSGSVRDSLGATLKDLLARYDGLFESPFPYSMGWHQAPFGGRSAAGWQVHAHFYPPLLRSATIRKFMVGYELLAEAQRDVTPERAAARLRSGSPTGR
jgi:UDPglucose--hexose-1-phosphate uridylyltransferase